MDRHSSNSSRRGTWRPRGKAAWTLTIVAALLAIVMSMTLDGMAGRAPTPGLPALFGFIGFLLPLHLLPIAAAAGGVAYLSRRTGARLAVTLSLVACAGITALALWPVLSQARLAREAGVPLSLAQYWTDSFRVLQTTAKPDATETYATLVSGEVLKLDVWHARGEAGDGPHPAIVQVHGGGWIEGARGATPLWNAWHQSRGYQVFDIDYRLAPQARWRDAVGDVKCAIGWVATHAAALDVDPDRIYLMGESAGGHLAMLAAYTMGDPALPASCATAPVRVRAVINLYGPTDLAALHAATPSPKVVHHLLESLAGGTPDRHPARYRQLSPLFHVTPAAPPTFSVVGLFDRLGPASQIHTLDLALARAGVRHESWYIPAADHTFDANWGLFGTQLTRGRIARFLDAGASPARSVGPQS